VVGKDNFLTSRIKALHGGKPPAEILARGQETRFKHLLRDRRLERERRGKSARERIAKVRAPMIKQLLADPDSAAAIKEFQKKKFAPRPFKKVSQSIPSFTSDIRSGSILTVVGPPYDFTIGWSAGPGLQVHQSDVATGAFAAFADGGGGYTDAVAGVGMFFNPVKDCLLRVSAYTPYNWSYLLQAGFFTAHSDGYFGWLITNATDQVDVFSSYDSIFSRGVGWFDSAEDNGSGFYQVQPLVFVQGGKWYRINLYCQVSVDDNFTYSFGDGNISGKAGFFVFEQFI
jgi:hypothetical protein